MCIVLFVYLCFVWLHIFNGIFQKRFLDPPLKLCKMPNQLLEYVSLIFQCPISSPQKCSKDLDPLPSSKSFENTNLKYVWKGCITLWWLMTEHGISFRNNCKCWMLGFWELDHCSQKEYQSFTTWNFGLEIFEA